MRTPINAFAICESLQSQHALPTLPNHNSKVLRNSNVRICRRPFNPGIPPCRVIANNRLSTRMVRPISIRTLLSLSINIVVRSFLVIVRRRRSTPRHLLRSIGMSWSSRVCRTGVRGPTVNIARVVASPPGGCCAHRATCQRSSGDAFAVVSLLRRSLHVCVAPLRTARFGHACTSCCACCTSTATA